jgi:hypothetical protein
MLDSGTRIGDDCATLARRREPQPPRERSPFRHIEFVDRVGVLFDLRESGWKSDVS